MLGFPIHAARPLDYSGTLVVVAAWIFALLGGLTILLVRLPAAWIHFALGSPELVRIALALVAVVVLGLLRPFVVARLPRAASLWGNKLVLQERGRRHRVRVVEIARVELELRPPPIFEVVVVVLADGTVHEVCPIDWPGAAGLYRAIARKVARRRQPASTR